MGICQPLLRQAVDEVSIPILAVSLAVFFLLDASETAITVIPLGQLIPMFITIWLTEQAIKQEFDQNGSRRS